MSHENELLLIWIRSLHIHILTTNCSITFSGQGRSETGICRCHTAGTVQSSIGVHMFPVDLVGDRSGWLPHISDDQRPNNQRGRKRGQVGLVQRCLFIGSFLQIKGSFSSKGGSNTINPYSQGNLCLNCFYILCGPMPPSLIDR